jgi:hypothetical protein
MIKSTVRAFWNHNKDGMKNGKNAKTRKTNAKHQLLLVGCALIDDFALGSLRFLGGLAWSSHPASLPHLRLHHHESDGIWTSENPTVFPGIATPKMAEFGRLRASHFPPRTVTIQLRSQLL